jgi:hypothetical protein
MCLLPEGKKRLFEPGQEENMKKSISVSLAILMLALVLVVPTSATPPAEVSGTYWMSAPPANRIWRAAGNNCIVEVDLTYEWIGPVEGTSTGRYRIVLHGPCGPNGPEPYKYHETLHGKGTFTGTVNGNAGSFDFNYVGENWPADPGELALTSRYFVLSGTGELANLHGRLDGWWIKGEPFSSYSGRVHFDP